jgi:hypothetical protein
VRKIYHTEGIDTCQPTVPDTVSVALAELAGEMREGLLAVPLENSIRGLTWGFVGADQRVEMITRCCYPCCTRWCVPYWVR